MEEMDFEQRRELRRQKREEMRLEAERLAKNDDDEEEAARERRRRARQERLKTRDGDEPSGQPDSLVMTNSHSVTETLSVSSSCGGGGDDEDQALLDRMAKREERRQRRMKEALERQRQGDPAETEDNGSVPMEKNNDEEERPSSCRRGRYRDNDEEEEEKTFTYSSRREEKQREEPREEEEAAPGGGQEADEGVDEEEEQEVEVVEDKPRRSYLREQVNERGRAREEREEQRKQNGGLHEDEAPKQHRKPERTLSRGSVRSTEVSVVDDEQDDDARLEAERKLEELKRRRDDAESEEFERMRQKQQEAEVELEELKKKREDRRKVLDEEEKQKKQEEEDRKNREEDEKRKMKEEIERRRAEAAEKRQKVEDIVDGEDKPFKCVSPRGSSLKIGERAEFLNKSAQKSTVKAAHSPVVSKIDNRLEQYTSAAQRENKESRSPRSGATDLPMVTDSIRNIKSMWERGSVFSSPGGSGNTFKEAAVMKTGVAGRINDWLNKTPESGKTSGGRPADLKPVDVTNKRSLWENKGASPTKVAGRGETKSVANGMGH
ncbi:caldesmon 1a isoform X2 [Limanda limanda]|uniref:caldesmon 1a isoform X2 n=1 Tax=Limanda limanda TaxID=27771 RepID=UPI0029C68D2B|nr:caldesmon 1a isoform X2 [Limanda limanda]